MIIVKFLLIVLFLSGYTHSQRQNSNNRNRPSINQNLQGNCLRGSCSPENGNLLIGRTKYLYASSTCGQNEPERYCVLGVTYNATQCYVCDSRHQYDLAPNIFSHTVDNIVSIDSSKNTERWWQSENGRQDVFIQFDLEAEFLFTHAIMTFKSIRPASMVIEKSVDFGTTWQPIAYFSRHCNDTFPSVSSRQGKLGDVYCEEKYSHETPTTLGQVVFRMLPPSLTEEKDPNSQEIQDLLKITNLRFNFTKLHTFGDTLLDGRDELKEKYYYALYELVVRGSCLCYGHANKCIRTPGAEYDEGVNDKSMVHGYCQCTHNTDGNNCEKCLPLFNDRPWRPARNNDKNECKKCECNNHADSCTFNDALFDESGAVSGGVCDSCQHNTEGRYCELCKPNHYRDPTRKIDDPFTCRPCRCVASGTTNEGKCDLRTDEAEGLVAGKCHCKENVDGASCDRCKNGFFNLTVENPEGCEPCSCNLIGTTGNLGCDKVTGSCSCKVNVAGRACDQCAPGYYGLSAEDPNGCKACDCYAGGSVGSSCDAQSGQCTCKPNMGGRRCDTPIAGYFCPALTHLTYEAEDAIKLNPERTRDAFRQPYQDRRATWTGAGFVRLYEGGHLEFSVNNVPTSAKYDIVLRYEQHPDVLTRFNIKLLRTDPYTDPSGPCANVRPDDDMLSTVLTSNNIHHIVEPSVCLEAGKNYRVQIEVVQLQSSLQRDSSVLIDSILLVPVAESLPEFKESEHARQVLTEYNYYRCKDSQLSLYEYESHEACKKFLCAVGVAAFGSLPCKCNPTGSHSSECDPLGGGCKCKPNVIGQKCDHCAASTFGFGPNGCQQCNCHPVAAKDNFCDVETGACSCFENIQGQKCDSCKPGFWYFPQCQACNCNGFADVCNQTIGHCIDCRENTDGSYCDRCREGYYGEPTNGVACKECMCPGGASRNQFAKTCYYDSRQDSVLCLCDEGYEGAACERCSINYHGNPQAEGGSCKQCECNGNTNTNDRDSCDQETGTCRNCLYNTAGEHCEVCAPGFYGNASNHDCRPCYCNHDGTEGHSDGNCDAITGQCRCLPNVVGRQCDTCKLDHYGLASQEGCAECDCDSDGTFNETTSCDQTYGQCNCLPSRGGRTCSECSFGYWGDPTQNNCQKCECNPSGSTDVQCDKLTGQCQCRKGITGYHCDRCDRGTYGQIPECRQCGECFDNWSGILADIKNQLKDLENQATNIAVKSKSSVNDFSQQYNDLEAKLMNIKKLLNANTTDRQVKQLHDSLNTIEKQILSKKEGREKIYNVENWSDPTARLAEAKNEYTESKRLADEVTNQANELIESINNGAKESILRSIHKSENNSMSVKRLEQNVDGELKAKVQQLKDAVSIAQANLDKFDIEKKAVMESTLNSLSASFSAVSSLNAAVCGGETSETKTCDLKCGGAGCNACGTNSSMCSGLADAYASFVAVKQKYDDLYEKTEKSFREILTKWRNVSVQVRSSNKEFSNLEERANSLLAQLNTKREDVKKLTNDIEKFAENFTKANEMINSDIEHIKNSQHKGSDEELNKLLTEIARLAETINVGSVEREAHASNVEANTLKQNVESVSAYSGGIGQDLERLSLKIDKKSKTVTENEEKVAKASEDNEQTKESVRSASDNLNKVSDTLSSLQKSVDGLRSAVDSDRDKNYQLRQEQVKSKIKESNVTLDRSKIALKQLSEKLSEITNNLPKSSNSDIDTEGLLIHLVNLNTNVLTKKEMLEKRNKIVKEYEENVNNARTKYEKLKQRVNSLQSKAYKLQQDIYEKLNFFSTCN